MLSSRSWMQHVGWNWDSKPRIMVNWRWQKLVCCSRGWWSYFSTLAAADGGGVWDFKGSASLWVNRRPGSSLLVGVCWIWHASAPLVFVLNKVGPSREFRRPRTWAGHWAHGHQTHVSMKLQDTFTMAPPTFSGFGCVEGFFTRVAMPGLIAPCGGLASVTIPTIQFNSFQWIQWGFDGFLIMFYQFIRFHPLFCQFSVGSAWIGRTLPSFTIRISVKRVDQMRSSALAALGGVVLGFVVGRLPFVVQYLESRQGRRFVEPSGVGADLVFDVTRIFSVQSKFQKIEVLRSEFFGYILAIDGDLMLTQRDEFLDLNFRRCQNSSSTAVHFLHGHLVNYHVQVSTQELLKRSNWLWTLDTLDMFSSKNLRFVYMRWLHMFLRHTSPMQATCWSLVVVMEELQSNSCDDL